ncbi:MAG: amidohydrolase family protein, partial [Segetibacter sp.]
MKFQTETLPIGDEFGVQYIIKGGGNEYQRIKEIAGTKATFILSLNYPQAIDVEDPNDARFVSLDDLKSWEMAPANAAYFERANIQFCLTAADLTSPKQFLPNLQKAFQYGLSENRAFDALTKTPATLLGIYDKVGSLDAGKLANFVITSGPLFKENSAILQNWVAGIKYSVREDGWNELKGTYALKITNANGQSTNYTLDVKGAKSASVIGRDTLAARFSSNGQLVQINFTTAPVRRRPQPRGDAHSTVTPESDPAPSRSGSSSVRLSGVNNGTIWQGNGEDSAGNKVYWTATLTKAGNKSADSVKKQPLA